MMKRAGIAVSAVFAVVAYAGCSAPAESPGEEPKVGSVSEAYTLPGPAVCAKELGTTSPWLIRADCSCNNYTGDAFTECEYERKVLQCLRNAGYVANCAALPPLPIVGVIDSNRATNYYEALNLNTYFPFTCSKQITARTCIKALNVNYTALPVAAQITHHCTTSLDPCYTSLTDPNFLAVFDPCSSSSCQR